MKRRKEKFNPSDIPGLIVWIDGGKDMLLEGIKYNDYYKYKAYGLWIKCYLN